MRKITWRILMSLYKLEHVDSLSYGFSWTTWGSCFSRIWAKQTTYQFTYSKGGRWTQHNWFTSIESSMKHGVMWKGINSLKTALTSLKSGVIQKTVYLPKKKACAFFVNLWSVLRNQALWRNMEAIVVREQTIINVNTENTFAGVR